MAAKGFGIFRTLAIMESFPLQIKPGYWTLSGEDFSADGGDWSREEAIPNGFEGKEVDGMPRIELSEKEAAILTEELESALEELRTERVRTDNRQLHAQFVERENLLAGLITRLQTEKETEVAGQVKGGT